MHLSLRSCYNLKGATLLAAAPKRQAVCRPVVQTCARQQHGMHASKLNKGVLQAPTSSPCTRMRLAHTLFPLQEAHFYT